jgi:hypothetical protein
MSAAWWHNLVPTQALGLSALVELKGMSGPSTTGNRDRFGLWRVDVLGGRRSEEGGKVGFADQCGHGVLPQGIEL